MVPLLLPDILPPTYFLKSTSGGSNMATAYKSNKITAYAPARAAIPGLNAVSEVFTFPAAPVINDTIEMVLLPKGAVISDIILDADDLDTGTPAILLQVGDGTTADKFIGASNVAQAGGVARMDKKGNIGVPLAADTKLVVKVSTGPATGAVGDIRLTATYNLEK
jgi:hypothetical protein